jgi:hypothetical protein
LNTGIPEGQGKSHHIGAGYFTRGAGVPPPRAEIQSGLGTVAGPVILATGRSEFEDGLGSGDFVSGNSYHMSVRTELPDQMKQTKFQSQFALKSAFF